MVSHALICSVHAESLDHISLGDIDTCLGSTTRVLLSLCTKYGLSFLTSVFVPFTDMLSPSRTLPQSGAQLQQSSHHSQSQQQQQQRPASRRSASSGSDLLQTKLRKLLNTADSKETIIPSDVALNSKYGPQSLESRYLSGSGLATNDCINKIGYIQPPKNYQQQLTVHPEQPSDVSVFFPSAFLSPQSLPPHPVGDDDLYLYSVHDSLVLTDDYHAISPPAEYAENSASPEKHNSSHR